jgi:hypothetical protein
MRPAVATAVAMLAAAGCASHRSYALVSVLSESGAFADVAQLQVDVINDATRDFLDYPAKMHVSFDEQQAVTFSVGFDRTKHKGFLQIGVTAIGADGGALGYGDGMGTIDADHVTEITVRVRRGASAPPKMDAGAAVDAQAVVDARTDLPPGMACDPAAPTACAGGTCFVACSSSGMPVGACTMAGSKMPGEVCQRNEDCTPGSQCFTLSCGVKICERFCKTDPDCGAGRCTTAVPCGTRDTGFRICSQACDPTGDGTSGCAPGLNCFLFTNETPDCDCRGPKRVGGDGASCTDSGDCQPGLFCVAVGAQHVCRALCRLDAPKCAAGSTCEVLHDPDLKIYGACLPP